MTETVDIYQYLDFRKFLQDTWEEKKKTTSHFSFRSFATRAGFSSKGYLSMVMDGKRNLTRESVEKIAKGLKMKKEEKDFFLNLVLFNQAKTDEEKQSWYELISQSRGYRRAKRLEHDRYDFLSHWYHIAIWEMTEMDHFRGDPAWIAKHLRPQISVREADDALRLLERLQLVRVHNGKYVKSEPTITTDDEVASLAICNFHREVLTRAADAITNIDPQLRELSALTIAVPHSKITTVKAMLREFRKQLHMKLGHPHHADTVYQIGFFAVPVTEEVE